MRGCMPKKILVIDDEAVLRRALKRFLEEEGYWVKAVENWEQGLAILKENTVDLLLVDLMLPRTSGIEVIQHCRKIQPHLVSIVMTGYGTIPSAIEAMRAGTYHYITKPFDLTELASLMAKALGGEG